MPTDFQPPSDPPVRSTECSTAAECEHDWKEEYYGTRCTKCGTFYAFGCEPWLATDPALDELQANRTYGDEP